MGSEKKSVLPEKDGRFRRLPAVDEVLAGVRHEGIPHAVVVHEARRVLAGLREALKRGEDIDPSSAAGRVEGALDRLKAPSLRRVINATGVVLHTNLGRAPLIDHDAVRGYCNLEYDLEGGVRGKRDVHAGRLLERLLGAPAIAVNNNAAAVYLALNELAAGFEAIVSRGELIEIGDGFRIPDIMRSSGAILREVGTTNRTGIEDYRDAINDRTRLLMRVHRSNFRIEGFTSRPALEQLAALGRARGLPVYEDLGSGRIVPLPEVDEPLVSESLRAGVDLVSFSGDKLMGGPQAGILAGAEPIIDRLRRNPMFRALRLDKLIYRSLEETLRAVLMQEYDRVPALAMIRASAAAIRERAERLTKRIPGAEIMPGESVIGGGSTPEQKLPTWLIALRPTDVVEFERALRANEPPVIARIAGGAVLIDLRTVFAWEEDELVQALSR